MKRGLALAALLALSGCYYNPNYDDGYRSSWTPSYSQSPVLNVYAPMQQPSLWVNHPDYAQQASPAPRFVPYGAVAGSMPGIGPGGYAR